MSSKGPILAAIPLEYQTPDVFWSRDLGLIVRGLRTRGVDARLVAFGKREDHPPDLPLILGSREDFENPQWWQKMKPSGILLTAWSASRFNKIRHAALSATHRVIEKLDTDGVRSPRIWPWYYALVSYVLYRDAGSPLKKVLAPGLTALRIIAAYCLVDRKIAGAMRILPALAAESPLAAERIRRFMRQYQGRDQKIFCIPHPVADDYMGLDPKIIRENRVVSVGRWNAYQKNFRLLLKVLGKFLRHHPGWQADVVGALPEGWNPTTQLRDRMLRERIHFHGLKPHREISVIYQRSKIFLMSSRVESFNIAAAEALCCGCSVVGPVEIASVPFFTGDASGTVACRQTSNHFLDALCAEAQVWEVGQRNPELISQKWVGKVGSVAIGEKIMECLESLPA